MKLLTAAATAVALLAAAPAHAIPFSVTFEKNWDYLNGDINGYYSGGTAADGSSGTNVGVSFVNVSGLSNDKDFTYYTNALSAVGVAYAHDTAYINIAGGLVNALRFYYATPDTIVGALKAYSGLNGTGTLLGTFDLLANGAYDNWTVGTFAFAGVARSFDLTAAGPTAAFDNISAVPEPETVVLLMAGVAAVATLRGRRRTAAD